MTQRTPQAFRIEPEAPEPKKTKPTAARKPQAVATANAIVTPDEFDVFDELSAALTDPPALKPVKRRSRLGTIFFSALGILVSLAVGLWADQLIRDLFSRNEWLGWLAAMTAAIAVIALVLLVVRELSGLMRLASVERLQQDATAAVESDDPKAARAVVDRLTSMFSTRADTASGRRMLDELRGDIVDGANLVRLAETELLRSLDERATTMIMDASKRVSMVTAVSPRALVDITYVIFELTRLIRRLSELYGGRPGTFGFLRLLRTVISHLAVTGTLAAGDTFVQQVLGHGLAARLSAKLGEGVVNGMMTARIGLAAMDTVRPLPFVALKRPGLGEFLSALTSFTKSKAEESA